MSTGFLALVLHAHLPYVRHPEYEEFLEEDWLYEAITETYIPLLQVFEKLVEAQIPTYGTKIDHNAVKAFSKFLVATKLTPTEFDSSKFIYEGAP